MTAVDFQKPLIQSIDVFCIGYYIQRIHRVFQKFVNNLKSLYFIRIFYISLHFLTTLTNLIVYRFSELFYESDKKKNSLK